MDKIDLHRMIDAMPDNPNSNQILELEAAISELFNKPYDYNDKSLSSPDACGVDIPTLKIRTEQKLEIMNSLKVEPSSSVTLTEFFESSLTKRELAWIHAEYEIDRAKEEAFKAHVRDSLLEAWKKAHGDE